LVRGCKIFDSTLGYPGEGWPKLSIATWNTRSLTFERFNFCNSLNYDILAITELWRHQERYETRSKKFIASKPKIIKQGERQGEIRYPEDRAAGVGILLSDRLVKKVTAFGSNGERVCWVRIRGPVCHLFVVSVYLPHRGRTAPAQGDTLADLQEVLSDVNPHDCVCVLGDLNEQVEASIKGLTGKWTGGQASKNADKVTQLLRLNQLAAVNTMFQPKKNHSVCTFLQTESAGNNNQVNDFGKYIGNDVKANYKGEWIKGVVESAYTNKKGQMRWSLRFNDDHVMQCTEKQMRNMLVYVRRKQIGRQLDYILIQNDG